MADDMRCQFADFEPLARKLLDRAEEASLWPLLDVSPLPHYQRGCALLIGDAAHATLPRELIYLSLPVETFPHRAMFIIFKTKARVLL